jgi:hypothetical protein
MEKIDGTITLQSDAHLGATFEIAVKIEGVAELGRFDLSKLALAEVAQPMFDSDGDGVLDKPIPRSEIFHVTEVTLLAEASRASGGVARAVSEVRATL